MLFRSGDGTTIHRLLPYEITELFPLDINESIIQVALGNEFSSALTSKGNLFMWGWNSQGQLGNETTVGSTTPYMINEFFELYENEKILKVSLGASHASALTSEGRLFTWGANWDGQLGDGSYSNQLTPVDITHQFNLIEYENITQISLGISHSSALTSEGRVFIWGVNSNGELGDGLTTNQPIPLDITNHFNLVNEETIVSVILGAAHSNVLTSEGRVFMWGYNIYGQLGDGTNLSKNLPNDITDIFNLDENEIILKSSLGFFHSSMLTSSSRLFIWGYNSDGQLGNGTKIDLYIPKSSSFVPMFFSESKVYIYEELLIERDPSREGYIFDGWYINVSLTTKYTFTNMPAQDIILYARWIPNE